MNIKFKISVTRKPKISFSEIVLENITREGPQIPFAAVDAKVRVEQILYFLNEITNN